MQIWNLDENNFYTGVSEFINKEDFDEESMTTTSLLVGHVKAKFNGEEWVEGATEKEIKEWNDSQAVNAEPTELEILRQEKETLAKSVYDLTTIVELILTGGIAE